MKRIWEAVRGGCRREYVGSILKEGNVREGGVGWKSCRVLSAIEENGRECEGILRSVGYRDDEKDSFLRVSLVAVLDRFCYSHI